MSNSEEIDSASSTPSGSMSSWESGLAQTPNDSSGPPSAKSDTTANKESSISPQKLEANRMNAQKSTGPKTEDGKARSRCNARKHGILSSALLIRGGYGAEDTEEFELFCAKLGQDLHPVGMLEEMEVERIAVCWWRQKRLLQAEKGLISRAFAQADTKFRILDDGPLTNPALATLRDHLCVPLGIELDRLLRYDSSVQRQLNNALQQLERMQRSRKGEHVPPPVTVEVSKG